jgi:hypothetical protein
MHGEAAPLGLVPFLSFCFSIIAAVMAIDMYRLLRTGEFGRTWRLLIIASVMLALLQVLRMAETLEFQPIDISRLVQIVELCFIMTLAYAFYLQRKLFTNATTSSRRSTDNVNTKTTADEAEYSLQSNYYNSYEEGRDDDYSDHMAEDAPIEEWPDTSALEAPETSKH